MRDRIIMIFNKNEFPAVIAGLLMIFIIVMQGFDNMSLKSENKRIINSYNAVVEQYNVVHEGGETLKEEYYALMEYSNHLQETIAEMSNDFDDLNNMLGQYQSQLGIIDDIVTENLKPIKFTVTAYSRAYKDIEKLPSDPYYLYNASMNRYVEGRTIAADTSVLPFGTKVYIPALSHMPNRGIFVVEDRGGAIKGYDIDVFFENTNESDAFGRQQLDVYILEKGNGKVGKQHD